MRTFRISSNEQPVVFNETTVTSRRVTRKSDGMRIADRRWRKMHLLHSAVHYLPAAAILSLRGGGADVAISI